MQSNDLKKTGGDENYELVRGMLETRLAQGGLQVPLLPEIAVRVMRLCADPAVNAGQLAALIKADSTLAMAVLRIANGVARRPTKPIVSLQQAVAWLGLDETTGIAFTLILQGRLLVIPGQNHTARQLWRHSLASALWARLLARRVAYDPNISYLCGLLHGIGKPVTLGAVQDIVRRAQVPLQTEHYMALIAAFYRPVGALVATAWELPPRVIATMRHWEDYAAAGEARIESNIVALAHALADLTLTASTPLMRELLVSQPVYTDLGLEPADAIALFESAAAVNADVDWYLPP